MLTFVNEKINNTDKLDIPVKLTKIDTYDISEDGTKAIGLYWTRENGETGKYVLIFNPNDKELNLVGVSHEQDNKNTKVLLKALLLSLINQIEVHN